MYGLNLYYYNINSYKMDDKIISYSKSDAVLALAGFIGILIGGYLISNCMQYESDLEILNKAEDVRRRAVEFSNASKNE